MPVLGAADNGPVLRPGISIPVGSLNRWRAGRDAAASQLVEVVCFGDSTTQGSGADHSWVVTLRALSIAAGFTDGGRGLAGQDDSGTQSGEGLDVVQSSTGWGAAVGAYDFFLGNTHKSTTLGGSVVFQGYGTQCRLHYSANTSTGSFSYAVDGGSPVTVMTNSAFASTEIRALLIPLGANGLHTVTIVNLGVPVSGPVMAGGLSQSGPGPSGFSSGSYDYVVTAANGSGETTPGPSASTTVPNGPRTISMQITNNGTATSYKVYRRVSGVGNYLLIATVTPSAGSYTSFTDDNTATPGAAAPSTNTYGPDAARAATSITPEFMKDSGIVYHCAGVSGTSIASWFGGATGDAFNDVWAGPVGLGLATGSPPAHLDTTTQWGNAQGAHPTYRDPVLAICALSINDQQGAADSAGAWASVQIVIDGVGEFIHQCRAADVDPLVVVPHLDYAANRKWSQRFREAVWSTASAMGAAVADFNQALGPHNVGVDLYTGGPHLNQAGYDAEAAWLWANVLSP